MADLDIEQPQALTEWLRATGRIGSSETPEIQILSGGVSNRTVLVHRPGRDSWVLKQALGRLRVPTPWHCSPERIHREALGMRWLSTLAPPGAVPALVFEDQEHHLLAMEAVPPPHENWKSLLLAGTIDSDHIRQFGQLLGSIHRRASLAADPLEPIFADVQFFEQLRLEPFYAFPAREIPAAAPFLGSLIEQTRGSRLGLVHGDYSPKNILVHRNRLVLVDHEVIHWGDPMFDVGFAVSHLLCKAHHDPPRRQTFAGAVALFWEHYQLAAWGCLAECTHEARAAHHALACLLARAAGRSPVNYLSDTQRAQQREVSVTLMKDPPADILPLAERFLGEIERRERAR
ncbi:MAG: phosphotransferase family protein [Limisphaerales bacterium]